MEWLKLLIPLIALAVWILSHLAKNREEPRRTVRPQPPPNPGEKPPPSQRSGNVVDWFLDEVRTRREKEAKPPAPVLREVPTQPEPRRPRPATSTKASASGSKPRRPAGGEAPKARSERRPQAQEALTYAPLASAPPSAPPRPAAAEMPVIAALGAPGQMAGRSVPPQLKQLFDLLKTPQSLRTAILLREVLGPPRCRRGQG